MYEVKRAEVTLIDCGEEVTFWLRSPTPFANEQAVRLMMEADIDMGARPAYVDPDGAEALLESLESLPREKRRTPEIKHELEQAKAVVAKVLEMTPAQREDAQRNANRRRTQEALDEMIISTSMLAALLTDSSPKDESHRPIHVYSREEAAQMIPPERVKEVQAVVVDLWPDAKPAKVENPGNPEGVE